jgi:hypothetical protein
MRYYLLLVILAITNSAKAQLTDTLVTPKKITKQEWVKLSSEYTQLQKKIKALEIERTELQSKMQAHDSALALISKRLKRWEEQVDSFLFAPGGNMQDQLLNATKQMQETQMSFNLQYLQLQSQMQHENRSYTAISNIMKTKHDTVKNSISNVR